MEHTENLGEVLFVNETVVTEERLREFYKKTTKGRAFWMILSAVLCIYFLIQTTQTVLVYHLYNLSLTWGAIGTDTILTGLMLALFLLYWLTPATTARRRMKSEREYQSSDSITCTYHFGHKFLCQSHSAQDICEYIHVSRIIDVPSGCLLIVANSGGYYIAADGFAKGTYAEFRQFMDANCPNLNKKGKQLTKPISATPQVADDKIPDDLGEVAFVNKTTHTLSLLSAYNRKVIRIWVPISVFFSLFALSAFFLLTLFSIGIFILGEDVDWTIIAVILIYAVLTTYLTVKYWSLPWRRAKKTIKHYSTYVSSDAPTLHYYFGDRFYVQMPAGHATYDYSQIVKIINTNFGCGIVTHNQKAHLIYSGGFTQGTYNDFRQFLAAKCPHLDKKRKP